jgi:hypothetical protein
MEVAAVGLISQIVNYCVAGIVLLLVLLMAIKLIRNQFSKPVEVQATVMDKRKSTYQKYTPAPEQAEDYILVFQSGNKSLSFLTSAWNYDSVEKGDHGTLKYRGSHLIEFKSM